MLLSCMDAFFTLRLLDLGAVEVNPIMAAVIGKSTATFAATKMFLTGFGILALVSMLAQECSTACVRDSS